MNTDEILRNYEGWLHKIANQMLEPSNPYHDDLVQEGRIAMWHALEAYEPGKGSLPSWLTTKAHYRMIEVVGRRRPWTGEPKRHSGWNAEDESGSVSIDAERKDGATIADQLYADELVSNMDLAYHENEIRDAVAGLTPKQREYVYDRFWLGLTNKPGGTWYGHGGTNRKGGARKKLAHELAHLEELAA